MKKFHVAAILLGSFLLILLTWEIGPGKLWRGLTLLGWGLIPFILMEGAVDIFHTLGWRQCLSPPHRSHPFHRLFGIRLAGSSINYFTPTASLGGEVIKGALLSLNHRGPEAATGVIIGKLAYALSQLVFAVGGSVLVLWKINLPLAAYAAMLLGSSLMGAGIVGFLVVQKRGKLGAVVRWLAARNLGGEMLKKASHQITQVDLTLRLFYEERPVDLALSMCWHGAGMICSILKTWYFLFLIGDGSFFAAAGIYILGTWFDLLTFPIPLGIGVQEGVRVLAFKALGFTPALGLTYGIALRVEQIFWAGWGLLFYAGLLAGKRKHGLFPEKAITSEDSSLE
jgi:hypothetical protein